MKRVYYSVSLNSGEIIQGEQSYRLHMNAVCTLRSCSILMLRLTHVCLRWTSVPQVDLFIKLITKQGLVLPVRRKGWSQGQQAANQDSKQDAGARSQTVYVLVSDLPGHHAALVGIPEPCLSSFL